MNSDHLLIEAFVAGDYETCLGFIEGPQTITPRVEGLVVLSAIYRQRWDLYQQFGQWCLSQRDPNSFDATIFRVLLAQEPPDRLHDAISSEALCRLRFYSVNMSIALGGLQPLRGLVQVVNLNADCPESHWAERQLLRVALAQEQELSNRSSGGAAEPLFDLSLVAQAYLVASHAEAADRVAAEVRRRLRLSGAERTEYGLAALSVLGNVYQGLGQHGLAIEIAEQTLEATRELLGSRHADVSTDLFNLGRLLLAENRMDEAIQRLNEAVSIRRELRDEAGALRAVGVLAQALGRKRDIVALQRLANDVESSFSRDGTYHETRGVLAVAIAEAQERSGDRRAAVSTLRAAIKTTGGPDGPNRADYVDLASKLAQLCQDTGSLIEAGRLWAEVAKAVGKSWDAEDRRYAIALQNLGHLRFFTRDYGMAEGLLRRAVELLKREPSANDGALQTAEANLAKVLARLGRYDEAVRLAASALEWRKREFGPEDSRTLLAAYTVANVYYASGRFDEAERLHRDNLDICGRQRNLPRKHQAENHAALGETLRSVGRFEEAEHHIGEALRIDREELGNFHRFVATGLENLALLCGMRGDADGSFEAADEAMRIENYLDELMLAGLPDRERMAYAVETRQVLYAALSLYCNVTPNDSGRAEWLYNHLGRRKGAVARASARSLREGAHTTRSKELVDRLRAVRLALANHHMQGPGEATETMYKSRLAGLIAQKEELEREMVRESEGRDLSEAEPAQARDILSAIGSDACLIEFIRYPTFDYGACDVTVEKRWRPDRYGAFVLAGSAVTVRFVDLGSAQAIDSLIQGFRRSIEAEGNARHLGMGQTISGSPDESRRLGDDLRKAVFDPLLPQIEAPTRVLIAPDGQLSLIPFETFPYSSSDYLIDRYEFTYIVTGQDLCGTCNPNTVVSNPPAVFAAPNFDARSEILLASVSPDEDVTATEILSLRTVAINFRFRALPGAKGEGENVAALLGVTPVLGEDATKDSVLGLRSPRILHLATHGFFLNPPKHDDEASHPSQRDGAGNLEALMSRIMNHPLLQSGVALTGANTWLGGGRPPSGAGNGLLLAEEVLSLDLHGTEMVVLSACETGLGTFIAGEGVFGLRRAFRLAGAKGLVFSLWRVFDDAAAALMKRFYQLILNQGKPMSHAAALRQAQLDVKRNLSPHPSRWGGFVYDGYEGPSPSSADEPRQNSGPTPVSMPSADTTAK